MSWFLLRQSKVCMNIYLWYSVYACGYLWYPVYGYDCLWYSNYGCGYLWHPVYECDYLWLRYMDMIVYDMRYMDVIVSYFIMYEHIIIFGYYREWYVMSYVYWGSITNCKLIQWVRLYTPRVVLWPWVICEIWICYELNIGEVIIRDRWLC